MLEPRQVKTIADAKAIVEQRKLAHVKVGVFDVDGIMRGKYISRAKFLSALESGYGFCDVVLGWDCQDQLYDNVQFTGWHTGYPDAPVRILPDSCRPLPFEDDNLLFLSEFAPPAEQVCPRGILRKVLAELAQEEGWESFDADLAAISLSALLDGLWLESGLNPGTFTPEQGIQICEAWVDGLQAGGRQRFCVQTSDC